jgi:hypothetical protein
MLLWFVFRKETFGKQSLRYCHRIYNMLDPMFASYSIYCSTYWQKKIPLSLIVHHFNILKKRYSCFNWLHFLSFRMSCFGLDEAQDMSTWISSKLPVFNRFNTLNKWNILATIEWTLWHLKKRCKKKSIEWLDVARDKPKSAYFQVAKKKLVAGLNFLF